MAASSIPSIDLSEAMNLAPVPLAHWLIVVPVLLPMIAGAVLLAFRHRRGLAGVISLPVLVINLICCGLLLANVLQQGPLTMVMGRWLPPFGIAFTADALGASMAFMAALLVLVAAIFARGEKEGLIALYGAQPFQLMLLAGVSGAFLTGDIFNLYVWFEVLLIASFGLLSLGSERAEIDGTLKYGFLNLLGTTLFLIAVGLLYGLTGTLNMADLAMRLKGMDGAPLVTLTALFLFAFGMKAAAFPVQFWLPASYHTPRATTAAIFAALLTKVGIYAILRVGIMLLPAPLEALSLFLGVVAAATMLFGALGVIQERDLRRLPGFVLISGIGTMLAGIALNSPGGASGAIFYALQSMVLMLALYLALFEAARLAGTGDIMRAGGLYDRHPLFSGGVLALFFASSGLPPFAGFWPKALIVKAALDIGAWWLAGAVLFSGFLMTAGLARAFLLGFWKPSTNLPAAQVLPRTSTVPLLALLAITLGFGLYPEPLMRLSGLAASGLSDPAAYIHSVFPALEHPATEATP